MATKKRFTKSNLKKRDTNYVKYGSSDKLSSIQGELRTAKRGNIAPTYFLDFRPIRARKFYLHAIVSRSYVLAD